MTAERSAGGYGFATLLRQRRRAAGLTQAELARLAGLSVRTVREAERGRTARPQRTTAVLLADALGLTGSDRTGFLGAARGDGPPPAVAPRAPGPGRPLPPAPALVGRERELEQLAELIMKSEGTGPIALVGVAGVGKSALALALAHRVADQFPGGVVGVSTDHDSVANQVLDAVGTVFGVPRRELLTDRLAGVPALLLLDGVDRAPTELRALLSQLPPVVRVLTTGRAPLDLPGERVWPLEPLRLPPAGGDPELAAVADYPAAALFLRRLAMVRPESLAADEVPALVGLVRRLGGLPLALELAAGHGRLLRLPEILQRYGDRVLDLGEGEDTLRAAVAGSYRLLSSAQQAAVRRLATFRGRWSVELAEQLLATGGRSGLAAAGGAGGSAGDPAGPGGSAGVRAGGADVVPLLDRLVCLGLVEVRGPGENRFRLLDVVRDFALEQADRRGELTEARRAHALVIAGYAARLAPALAGPGLAPAVDRLDDLAGEVWAALNHAANDDPPTALALAAWLPRWWRFRGRDRVGRQWLRRLLADPRTATGDPAVRAWAMVGLAQLAFEHGEGGAERPAAEAALREFRRRGEVAGELAALRIMAAVCVAGSDYESAREHSVAALTVATQQGRHHDAAIAQLGLAWHEVRVGELAAARRRLAAVDRLGAESGDRRLRLLAAASLAEILRLAGRYEEAVATGHRILAGLAELGGSALRNRALGTLGSALAAAGRIAEAEQVLARLRAEEQPAGGSAVAGVCAMIEGRLALARGDRVAAAEWFSAALPALSGGEDARQRVEVLVELVACLPDPQRRRQLRQELAELCQRGGIALLERERVALGDRHRARLED